MKNWLIKKLGGFTLKELYAELKANSENFGERLIEQKIIMKIF